MSRWAQAENVVWLLTKIMENAVYYREGGVVLYRLEGDEICRLEWRRSHSLRGRAEVAGGVWNDVPRQPPEAA